MEISSSKFKKGKEAETGSTSGMSSSAMSQMVEMMPINVLFADLEGTITYANAQSIATLKTIEKELPVPVDRILGGSYDIFHKNPSHQRRILSNERNLPHRATISLGAEKLDLLVTAVRDEAGKYIGPMVTWEIVTQKLKTEAQNIDYAAQVEANKRQQAFIEFTPDGTVVTCNENFYKTLGYSSAEELKGKHHRIFCDSTYTGTTDYRSFWEKLGRGDFDAGEYKRITKDGKAVWISASYNPIKGPDGKVVKVVKYATDITKQKEREIETAKISSMMDQAPVNAMFCGTDLVMTYMNPKSRDTLRTLEKFLPISVDKMIGNSIDVFHKRPEHQRKLLSDPRNLPYKAKIKVGPETLDLLVSGIFDANRNYIGAMVTWEVISLKLQIVEALDQTSQQLATAAEELSAVATQMSKNAGMTSERSTSAAAASEEVSKGVQTVATNTEEMVASIKEIAKSSSEAAGISKDAMKKASDTNGTINQLGEASQEIGNVIKVISSIAQQTNLLALNATIEAARAGDAGKGFAVVANEVKELAKQTAKATEDITIKIGAIQETSKGAVGAIGGISKIIEQINGISMTIAAAVEEQTATTNEVSRVMQESNSAVDGIAQTVKQVATAANESASGANQTLEAAKNLSQLASRLKDLVKKIEV